MLRGITKTFPLLGTKFFGVSYDAKIKNIRQCLVFELIYLFLDIRLNVGFV